MSTPPDDGDRPRQWPPPYDGDYASGPPPGGPPPIGRPAAGRGWTGSGRPGGGRAQDERARAGGASPDDPLVATDLSGWFERIFGVVRRSWKALLLLAVVSAAPQVGLLHYTTRLQDRLRAAPASVNDVGSLGDQMHGLGLPLAITGLITVVVTVLVQPAAIWLVVRQADGRDIDAVGAARFALKRALPLLGWSFVAGVLIVVGFICLVIPGVYLALVILPTLGGVVIIQRGGITDCFALIRGRFWATTGRVLLYGLLALAYSSAVTTVLRAVADPGSALFIALDIVLTIPLAMTSVGFTVATYAELRHRRDRSDTAVLAGEVSA